MNGRYFTGEFDLRIGDVDLRLGDVGVCEGFVDAGGPEGGKSTGTYVIFCPNCMEFLDRGVLLIGDWIGLPSSDIALLESIMKMADFGRVRVFEFAR